MIELLAIGLPSVSNNFLPLLLFHSIKYEQGNRMETVARTI
jgi:hypothetical protein